MASDAEESAPIKEPPSDSIHPSDRLLIGLGIFLGVSQVWMINVWLNRPVRIDLFSTLTVLFAVPLMVQLRMFKALVLGALAMCLALLCGIALEHVQQRLHWHFATLIGLGAVSGGLIAVSSILLRQIFGLKCHVKFPL